MESWDSGIESRNCRLEDTLIDQSATYLAIVGAGPTVLIAYAETMGQNRKRDNRRMTLGLNIIGFMALVAMFVVALGNPDED